MANVEVMREEMRWVIQDIGTVSSFSNAHQIDFSDNGQILFSYKNPNKYDEQYGIGSPESGLILLPEYLKDLENQTPRFIGEGLIPSELSLG